MDRSYFPAGKDAAPASSLHGRTKSTKQEVTPAPGDYNPEKAEKIILDNSPKYSFGIKTHTEKISCTPGEHTFRVLAFLYSQHKLYLQFKEKEYLS